MKKNISDIKNILDIEETSSLEVTLGKVIESTIFLIISIKSIENY
jgi:hypothetical protein